MEQSPSYEADSDSGLLWNPKVHLPCSQEPTTSPYPEPDESIPQLPTLFP